MLLAITLGAFTFVLMAGADWAGYKQIPILKPVLWLAMMPVSVTAILLGWSYPARFYSPVILSVIAWLLFLLFMLLFLYSLFFEIPLKRTYIDAQQPSRVVADGTYSLCRHPAFLWFIGWMTALVMISGSITLALAVPVWVPAYIGCLFLEEKICCKESFADEYKRYQKNTPMLIPNSASIKRFLSYMAK